LISNSDQKMKVRDYPSPWINFRLNVDFFD
jgi:hypothetical protein